MANDEYIAITRGDCGIIQVAIDMGEDGEYEMTAEDTIELTVRNKPTSESPVILHKVGAAGIINSSTPGSKKKFKITIGDDARPTFTDTSNPNNTWTPGDSRYIINGHVWNYNGVNYICTDETPDQLTTMYESGKDIFLDFNEERFKYTGSLFYTIMATDEDNTGIKGAAIAVVGNPMAPDINWNCPYKGVCNFGVFPFNIQSEG